MTLANEMLAYYDGGQEVGRFSKGIGPLELARTQELIARYLPPPPAVVCDVGGGPGVYSFWLASLGYDAHLIDVTPLHIELAQRSVKKDGAPQLASMAVGDARALNRPDESADAVIMHGPLYHLTEREDRLLALAEAKRVLRPGGVLLAFAITRYASTIVGLIQGWVWDADYLEMVREELATGQHRRPPSWPTLFTTAFFHHPDDLGAEVEEAGMAHKETLAVQGPAWMVPEFTESWKDAEKRDVILKVARMMEKEPVMSPHIVAIAHKGS